MNDVPVALYHAKQTPLNNVQSVYGRIAPISFIGSLICHSGNNYGRAVSETLNRCVSDNVLNTCVHQRPLSHRSWQTPPNFMRQPKNFGQSDGDASRPPPDRNSSAFL